MGSSVRVFPQDIGSKIDFSLTRVCATHHLPLSTYSHRVPQKNLRIIGPSQRIASNRTAVGRLRSPPAHVPTSPRELPLHALRLRKLAPGACDRELELSRKPSPKGMRGGSLRGGVALEPGDSGVPGGLILLTGIRFAASPQVRRPARFRARTGIPPGGGPGLPQGVVLGCILLIPSCFPLGYRLFFQSRSASHSVALQFIALGRIAMDRTPSHRIAPGHIAKDRPTPSHRT